MEALRIQGAMVRELTAEAVRELTTADLELLNTDRGVKPVSIQRLRDSHHALAKALARGMDNTEASVHTGYSISRISILRSDPAFSELVESYRQQQNLAEANVTERISTLKLDFLEELRSRLEEKPETFSNRETLDCFKELADRSGNGPTRSMNVNQTVVTMQDLLELSKGLHDDAGVTIIESRTVDSGPAVGDAQRLVALASGELQGLEGEGDIVSEQGRSASQVDEQERGTSGGAS
jgi:hypothetical protein